MKEKITQGLSSILTIFIVLFWVSTVYYALTFNIPRARWGILFLGASIIIYTLDELSDPIDEGKWIPIIALSVSGIVSVIVASYFAIYYQVLMTSRVAYALPREYALAIGIIPVITYLAWREFGRVFLFMIVGMILYTRYGWIFPGVVGHGGLTWTRILQISVTEIEGIFGSLTRIVGAWVALFLLYAGLLSGYGAFGIIVRAALRTTKYIRSGVTQTAIVSSTIIGSINGSRTANAAMTGSITIPMMKDVGLPPETAAAVEADASSLGQILPPVMGSAGFLMASFLGISYPDVMIGATIPALILIGTIGVAAHYRSVDLVPDPDVSMDDHTEDFLERRQLIIEIAKFIIPFFILVYLLGVARVTVPTAALYTCIAMVGTGTIFPILFGSSAHPGGSGFTTEERIAAGKEALVDTLEGLKTGALVLAPVAIIVAAINLVIDLLLATGVPGSVTLAMMSISGGVMIIAVFIAMIIGIILGMGMPTVAAYTIVAILVAPTFINQFGVPEMGAHFFALYVGLLSGITPPIASAVAVTSGIAGGKFLKSCWEAIRLYAPAFIIPISFLYHPEIVSSTWDANSWMMGGIIFIGSLSIVYGLNFHTDGSYWSLNSFVPRLCFVIAGAIAMTHPLIQFQLSAIAAAALVMAISRVDIREIATSVKTT